LSVVSDNFTCITPTDLHWLLAFYESTVPCRDHFGLLLLLTSYFYLFCYFLYAVVFTQYTFKALNGLVCADVPLRNYSLTAFPPPIVYSRTSRSC